jgi:hypothetical protein
MGMLFITETNLLLNYGITDLKESSIFSDGYSIFIMEH